MSNDRTKKAGSFDPACTRKEKNVGARMGHKTTMPEDMYLWYRSPPNRHAEDSFEQISKTNSIGKRRVFLIKTP